MTPLLPYSAVSALAALVHDFQPSIERWEEGGEKWQGFTPVSGSGRKTLRA